MGFKISLPYLPSEQGDWRAYFLGDDSRMEENFKRFKKGKQLRKQPDQKKGRATSDPAFAL